MDPEQIKQRIRIALVNEDLIAPGDQAAGNYVNAEVEALAAKLVEYYRLQPNRASRREEYPNVRSAHYSCGCPKSVGCTCGGVVHPPPKREVDDMEILLQDQALFRGG